MIRLRSWAVVGLVLALAVAASCGRRDREETSGDEEGTPIVRGNARAELCTETGDQYIQMPYDTNGDGAPDVIRVYLITDTANQNGSRLGRRIVCREADLNGDGVRDVYRRYDDQQRVAYEQQDRNFDGDPDYWEVYENGHLLRIEEDTNGDGRIDTRTFMDIRGRPERIERDLSGSSEPGHWRADRYEFFSEGRLVRMGEDLDHDGAVDRWNRDRLVEEDVRQREQAALDASDGGVPATGDGGVAASNPAQDGGAAPDAGIRTDAGTRAAAGTDAGIRVDSGAQRRDAGVNDAGRPATSRP